MGCALLIEGLVLGNIGFTFFRLKIGVIRIRKFVLVRVLEGL